MWRPESREGGDVDVIDLNEKFSHFDDRWAPRIVAKMNDYHIKLARIQGAFVWHSHPETDEVFYVVKGSMVVELRDREITLEKGQLYVVPRGVEHKPRAEEECLIMLVERAGTINTGDAGGDRTAAQDEWV